eukprot:scaffold69342_cov51-Phaeocystis_antarctica.AAC.1
MLGSGGTAVRDGEGAASDGEGAARGGERAAPSSREWAAGRLCVADTSFVHRTRNDHASESRYTCCTPTPTPTPNLNPNPNPNPDPDPSPNPNPTSSPNPNQVRAPLQRVAPGPDPYRGARYHGSARRSSRLRGGTAHRAYLVVWGAYRTKRC